MIKSILAMPRHGLWSGAKLTFIHYLTSLPTTLLLVLLVGTLLNGLGIWWGVLNGSSEDWASDTLLPHHVFSAAASGFQNGWHSRYPPFHFQLLTVLYAPFLSLHLLDFVDVYSFPTYTALLYLGRFLTLAMAVLAVILVYHCARSLQVGVRGAVLAAAITSFNPLFVFYSKTTNLDLPYTMWFLASLLFAIRTLRSDRSSDYILFSLSSTLAVCTKDQAFALYVLMVPLIAYSCFRSARQQAPNALQAGLKTARRLLVPALAAATLFSAIHSIPFNLEGFLAHIELIIGPASQNWRVFENSPSGHLQMLIQSLQHLIFALGLPLFLVCSLGVMNALRHASSNRLFLLPLVSGVSYYMFFISVVGYNYDRFFLPVCTILSIYGGKWLADLLEDKHLPRFVTATSVWAVLAFSLVYAASVDTLMIADSRYEALSWMEENIDRNALISGVGATYYLPPLNSYRTDHLGQSPSVPRLTEIDPDYIVTSSIYEIGLFHEGTEGYELFAKLHGGELGYDLVFQHQGKPIFSLLNREGIITNLDKINPQIRIFRRADLAGLGVN